VYEAIKGHLKPEEFVDPFFVNMATMIFDGYKSGSPLQPASAINKFDTVDEQNLAAAIFNNTLTIESSQQFEKMLNGNIKLVKRAYIEELSRELTDPKKMQELIQLKKEMQSFHIVLE
jgi:DNA primase